MLVPAGVEQSFVTSGNSPSLSVGMSVYDNSGASPSLVAGPTLMTNFVGNSYQSKYTFPVGEFLVFIAVYTDNTLTSLLTGYEEQIEAISSRSLAFNASVQSVVGTVDCGESFPSPSVFKIYQGDEKTLYLKAVNAGCSSDPLDLTDCTEIVINLPNADGTITQLKLSEDQVQITDPAVLGKFSAEITAEVSALLNVGQFQNVDVTFTIGGEVLTVPFIQALSVYEVA